MTTWRKWPTDKPMSGTSYTTTHNGRRLVLLRAVVVGNHKVYDVFVDGRFIEHATGLAKAKGRALEAATVMGPKLPRTTRTNTGVTEILAVAGRRPLH